MNTRLFLNKTKQLAFANRRFFRSDLCGTSGRVENYSKPKKPSVTVSITGAAGQIGYASLFRIASGAMLGQDQPIYINAIELPGAMNALKGVAMELEDCAFPLLKGVMTTDSLEKGFENTDYALLIGSKPRGPGQERADLLKANGLIFQKIGKALKFAKPSCKTIVVGNPANTNCMILAHNAPDTIDRKNFTSMMRLDHDRGQYLAASTLGQDISNITEFCVWGNHSPSMFPDLTYTRVCAEVYRHVYGNLEFDKWNEEKFIPTIQQRGAAVINARGASSAASAANACIAQVRDWVNGNDGRWVSMGVESNGAYGIPKGIWSGFPIEVEGDGEYKVVKDLPLSVFQEKMIEKTKKDLMSERDAVCELL